MKEKIEIIRKIKNNRYLLKVYSFIKAFIQGGLGCENKKEPFSLLNFKDEVGFCDKSGISDGLDFEKSACKEKVLPPTFEGIFFLPLNTGKFGRTFEQFNNLKAPERLVGRVFSKIDDSISVYKKRNSSYLKNKYVFCVLSFLFFLGIFFWYTKTLNVKNLQSFQVHKSIQIQESNSRISNLDWVYFWK